MHMSFEPSFSAGVGLLGTLSAFFLGFALAVAILAVLRLGDGKGGSRVSLIIIACSLAIAAGTWVFVLAVRNGLVIDDLQWYVLTGLALGLLCSLFPKLVGIPALTMAVLAVLLAASELAGWHAWEDGLQIVELKIYAADPSSSLCGLSLPDKNSVPVLQNLRLASGPLVLELEVLEISGPMAFLFGRRYYRLDSLGVADEGQPAGTTGGPEGGGSENGLSYNGAPLVHTFPARRGTLEGQGVGSPIMGYLGLNRSTLRSAPLPAEDMAQARYVIEADGSLTSTIR
jgi:hypothetical protein